jgi:hypothetical protein
MVKVAILDFQIQRQVIEPVSLILIKINKKLRKSDRNVPQKPKLTIEEQKRPLLLVLQCGREASHERN